MLKHTCQRYGVLTRGQLAELSGARHWTRGVFSFALAAAVEQGIVRDLGLGFYAPPRLTPEVLSHGRTGEARPR